MLLDILSTYCGGPGGTRVIACEQFPNGIIIQFFLHTFMVEWGTFCIWFSKPARFAVSYIVTLKQGLKLYGSTMPVWFAWNCLAGTLKQELKRVHFSCLDVANLGISWGLYSPFPVLV